MTTKIIFVLSEARTGSTLLCDLIDHYDNTVNFHEIFHDVGHPADYDAFKVDVNFNNVLQDQFGDGIFDQEKMFPRITKNPKKLLELLTEHVTKTVIVKAHLFQLIAGTYPVSYVMDWVLSQPNHKFILLERQNFLASHVSVLKAEQLNLWHNIDTTNTKVEIDPVRFKKELTANNWRYSYIRQKLKDHQIDYLNVDYDRDLKNYNISEFEQLIEPWAARNDINLGSARPKRVKVTKQNTSNDIADSISNWAEVSAILTANLTGRP